MNVKGVPVSVQLGQLEPIKICGAPSWLEVIVGPAQAVRAYWLPEESFT